MKLRHAALGAALLASPLLAAALQPMSYLRTFGPAGDPATRLGWGLGIVSIVVMIVIGLLLLALSPVAGIPPYAWLAGSAFLVGAGAGVINPASRNAGLQLAPEQASTLAALRSMCLQIGTIVTISIVTAILASSNDPGSIQAWVYVVAALLLVVALPLITRLPEHHGSW
jgi:hypothetical protein